jgi:ribosomal protein S18 acetylase RimI-like enzyme
MGSFIFEAHVMIFLLSLMILVSVNAFTIAKPPVRTGQSLLRNNMSNPQPNETPTTATINKAQERIQWTIRPATLDDRENVNSLLRASYSNLLVNDYDPDTLTKALPLLTAARDSLLTSGTWYVVHPPHQPNALVGCGGWTLEQPTQTNGSLPSAPHLRHFATDPTVIRQGVARTIWQQTWKDISETLGSDTILEVYSTITAVSFYASLGFETVEDTKVTLPTGDEGGCDFSCVLMRRHPPPAN